MASDVIRSTLQLLGVPGDINEETVIKMMNKHGGELVQVKQVRMLSDVGFTLVTITATEKGESNQLIIAKPYDLVIFQSFFKKIF